MIENQIGHWAVCGAGKVGKVERIDQTPTGHLWSGTSVDGTAWQSKCPQILRPAQSVALDELTEKAWRYDELR